MTDPQRGPAAQGVVGMGQDAALDHELVLDHSRRPRHHGLRAPFDVEVRHLNPVCGDRVVLRVALDGTDVRDVSYEALGCAISQASTSMLAELVVGLGVSRALALEGRFTAAFQHRAGGGPPDGGEVDDAALGDALALTRVVRQPVRVRCALLGWKAFEEAAVLALAGSPAA